ncbi:MAG: sugar ABC transporter ATP-binding protein [Clostridia bacterium]
MSQSETLLRVNHITKTYPGVCALSDVNFSVDIGEVRALVGENGAGKSTLIRQIMGVETADSGCVEIACDGEWRVPKSAIDAKGLGMHANYQHVNIAKELSVGENYFLGNMPQTKLGTIDWKTVWSESRKVLERFSMNVDPCSKIADLTIAMQAMVTISKISMNQKIRLVIFDEPTALLENDKVEILFNFIRELKVAGVSVIYVSHRIEEIMEICDSVTVLKDGCYVDTKPIGELDKNKIISMMVGREMTDIYNIKHGVIGEELLRVEHFSDEKHFKDVNFSVHAGEIVGFFGLIGAGRSELMKCLFGAERATSGDVFIRGRKARIRRPADAMKRGIGLIPEDRRKEGLALQLSVKINVNMSSYHTISKCGLIDLKKETKRAEEYRKAVGIRTPSVHQTVENLSGGNQQKTVISKLLACNPDIFIFDEPTIGVDVGAKQEIFKIMEQLVSDGKGIIVVSSYLPEAMGLSDRMYVMADGAVKSEITRDLIGEMTEKDILKIASQID